MSQSATFDLKTKVQRAIVALIIAQGSGTVQNTFAGEVSGAIRPIPNTTVDAGEGVDENQTGNQRFAGEIIFHDAATNQPADADQAAFKAARERIDLVLACLTQTVDNFEMDVSRQLINQYGNALAVDQSNGQDPLAVASAAANSDMTDFSMLYWRVVDYGRSDKSEDAKALFYERVVRFEALACNTGGLG